MVTTPTPPARTLTTPTRTPTPRIRVSCSAAGQSPTACPAMRANSVSRSAAGQSPAARPAMRVDWANEALTRCVEPIDVAEFLAEHWEQQPLAVPRSEEGRFDDLLSVA